MMGICLGRFIQNLFLKSRYQSRNKLLKPVFAQFNTLGLRSALHPRLSHDRAFSPQESTVGFHMAGLAAREDAKLSHGRDFTPRTCGQLDRPWAWDMDWTPLFKAESPQCDSLGWSESASGSPGDIPAQISPAL